VGTTGAAAVVLVGCVVGVFGVELIGAGCEVEVTGEIGAVEGAACGALL